MYAELSRQGASIILVGRCINKLSQTLKQMEEGNHLLIDTDLANFETYDRMFQNIKECFTHGIDGFVHFAGHRITKTN